MALHDELVHGEGDLPPRHNLPLEPRAVNPTHQAVAAIPHVPLRVVLGELDLGQLLVLVTGGLDHFPGISLVSRDITWDSRDISLISRDITLAIERVVET